MQSRFKRSRRPSNKTTRKRRSTTKKVSSAVKTYVKRTIHKNIENKLWITYGLNQTLVTASGGNPIAINVVPFPPQSTTTTQSTRIGNAIKVVKGYIRGHVNLLPYNATTNPYVGPVYIKMWLCSNKTINTSAISATNCSADFFEVNGGTTGFQGNMLDMEFSNNRDNWIIYKTKTFELGTTAVAGFASANSAAWNDNSRFSKPFYFSFGRHMKRQIKFVDSSTTPTNINMFLIMQAVYADGSSSSVNSAEYHYSTRVEYEDA